MRVAPRGGFLVNFSRRWLLLLLALPLVAGCMPEIRDRDDCRTVADQGTIIRIDHVTLVQPLESEQFSNVAAPGFRESPAASHAVGRIAGSADTTVSKTIDGVQFTIDLASGPKVVVAYQKTAKNSAYRVGDPVRFLIDCYGTVWVWRPEDTASITGEKADILASAEFLVYSNAQSWQN